MSGVLPRALIALLASACLAMAGCGGGGSSSETTSGAAAAARALRKAEEKARAEAPKGASPVLVAIYRQFRPPQPNPEVKGSGKAIEKGERSCKGKSPLEVKEEFIEQAELLPEQEKMVAKLSHYEDQPPTADFVAGQLGALVYEAALSNEELASYGYQGCVYALAKRLERELAPR